VINGLKHFITNGDVAHLATVLAVTDKQKRTRGRISFWFYQRDSKNVKVGREKETMPPFGDGIVTPSTPGGKAIFWYELISGPHRSGGPAPFTHGE
jgi:hypothetical protein